MKIKQLNFKIVIRKDLDYFFKNHKNLIQRSAF